MGDGMTPGKHFVVEFKIDGEWSETTAIETMARAEDMESVFHNSDIIARIIVIKREFA